MTQSVGQCPADIIPAIVCRAGDLAGLDHIFDNIPRLFEETTHILHKISQ